MNDIEKNLTVAIDGISWTATYRPSTGTVSAMVIWENFWDVSSGNIPDEFINCVIAMINAVEPDPDMPDDIREQIRRVSQEAYGRRVQPSTIGRIAYVPARFDELPTRHAGPVNLDQRFGRIGRTDPAFKLSTRIDHAELTDYLPLEKPYKEHLIPLEMMTNDAVDPNPEEESDMEPSPKD